MASLLRDSAFFQEKDPVAETGAGKAVRDEQGGFALRHFHIFFVDLLLRKRIQSRRGLVQNQDLRSPISSTSLLARSMSRMPPFFTVSLPSMIFWVTVKFSTSIKC